MRAAVRSTGMFGVKLPLPVDIASVSYYADVDQASAVVDPVVVKTAHTGSPVIAASQESAVAHHRWAGQYLSPNATHRWPDKPRPQPTSQPVPAVWSGMARRRFSSTSSPWRATTSGVSTIPITIQLTRIPSAA